MSDIMEYLAMFITTMDKIICFLGPYKMKMSHYLVSDTLWNLGLFSFPKTPPIISNFSQLKPGTFLPPTPYLDQVQSFPAF